MARYVIYPGTEARKIAPHVPLAHASVAEPLGVALNGLGKIPLRITETVVVLGEGPIGLMFAGLANHIAITGAALPMGSKPVIDDGHNFVALAGIPALTHGPAATGAHTLKERVSVQELVRVAQVYALTAVAYCSMSHD